MRVHKDHKIILLCFSEDLDSGGDPFFVVDTGTTGFNRFPGKDVTDGVVTVVTKALEVEVGFGDGEGLVKEGNVVTVEEVCGSVGWNVGGGRVFGVGGAVDAPKSDFSVVFVFEVDAVDGEELWHCGRMGDVEEVGGEMEGGEELRMIYEAS